MDHRSLQQLLYGHLQAKCGKELKTRYVVQDLPLGSIQKDNARRADVFRFDASYTRPNFTIYEVKVSRADFQSDIRSGKYLNYLEHCNLLYFVCPRKMVSRGEIPDTCGLVEYNEEKRTFHTAKMSPARDCQLPYDTLLSIAFGNGNHLMREVREERWRYLAGLDPSRRYRDRRRQRALQMIGCMVEVLKTREMPKHWDFQNVLYYFLNETNKRRMNGQSN